MKRYETMSKEEIMAFFTDCQNRSCNDCVREKRTHYTRTHCAKDYLNEEVPEPLMVRRYQNICCKQDLVEALGVVATWCAEHECSRCKYDDEEHCKTLLFIDHLGELEPEREKEWYLDEKYHKSRKIKA